MSETISTTYDPNNVEAKWYRYWEQNGFFKPGAGFGEPFSIVMPPPNVTGSLHLGHALDSTFQDILTRWRRMQGRDTLWLPGTDHAGIATQARVEEQLSKDGVSKVDLGREDFLRRVWDWKEQYGNQITNQLRLMGASCDWTRERFTMDDGCSRAVREVFARLYHKGLIYRGNYIVNWCPRCGTTISDIEVEHREQGGSLWYLKYPLDGEEGFLTVATTRPETMLGDTAVAVHPEDERYAGLVGRHVILPLTGRTIPVIADDYVEKEFGTGAVKITPAHDPNDFEIGVRHQLEHVVVIGLDGKMTGQAGKYESMDRYEARQAVLRDLEQGGYLLKREEHLHGVGHCYRCDTVIEPLVSQQWFVRMKPLAEPAMEAVRDGHLKFVPERFSKIYLGWLENIRDWCISRQLWWGHRIPVWYCRQCNDLVVTVEDPLVCPKCGGGELEQDPDVLDTWFSSALWPFSTLGWPDETGDLHHYYPTSVLVTGRDIIFFWVARMIFMALEFTGQVPFHEVFIHGLVLDSLGRKMSKSLGNGIDPIEVIANYGADTLRFMLVTGNTPGNDLRFNFDRLEGVRNFTNKVWNASRFALMHLHDFSHDELELLDLEMADRWILSRYNTTVEQVTGALEEYELGEAARLVYDFIWGEFCDWYLEVSKARLYSGDGQDRRTAQGVLYHVLINSLKLLHPFMPFLTEEVWHALPHSGQSIMLANWPRVQAELNDDQAEGAMNLVMEVVRSIRNLRSQVNLPPSRKARIILHARERDAETLEESRKYLENLGQAEPLAIADVHGEKPEHALAAVVGGVEVYLPLQGLVDVEKETSRLRKELSQVETEIKQSLAKLNNDSFLKRAPEAVVEKEKTKYRRLESERVVLVNRIEALGG